MTSHAMESHVGSSSDLGARYSKVVSENTTLPVVAKMTPNIADRTVPALAAIQNEAVELSTINTVKFITNFDFETMAVNGKPLISGYSGAVFKPIALCFVTQILQHTQLHNVELSGIGGIETWKDDAEFLLLRCRNLHVTTSVMQYGYRIVEDIKGVLA